MAEMELVASKPKCMTERPFHYCPGCTHGVIHRMIGECIDEMNLKDRFIGVAPVGCSVFAYWYYDCDFNQAAHGRAPAVATGIKRSRPDSFVLSYQGDGDLAAIGTAEIIHAANRGEKITVIFINNAIYGMTGGQMAPTSLVGMKTQTSPYGRDPEEMGYPMRVCELLQNLPGVKYLARTSTHTSGDLVKTKKAIQNAFQCQIDGHGFSLVEILSICPTNWAQTPVQSTGWLKDNMLEWFKPGVFKTPEGSEA